MKNLVILSILATMILLTGCVRVDYIGQRLPVRMDGNMKYFASLEEVPGDYKPIGRATALFPNSYIDDEIDYIFSKKAVAVGAEAIARVSTKRVVVGVIDEVEAKPVRPSGNWGFDNTNLNGEQEYINSFGERTNLKVAKTKRYKIKADVVFLVPIELYETYLNRTNQEVLALVEEPLSLDEKPLDEIAIEEEQKNLREANIFESEITVETKSREDINNDIEKK